MKSFTEYSKLLEQKKDESLKPVEAAVHIAMLELERQQERHLKDPVNVNAHAVLGAEMPSGAYYRNSYDMFLTLLNAKLKPLGWNATQSHDGGGMYATYAVRPLTAGKA